MIHAYGGKFEIFSYILLPGKGDFVIIVTILVGGENEIRSVLRKKRNMKQRVLIVGLVLGLTTLVASCIRLESEKKKEKAMVEGFSADPDLHKRAAAIFKTLPAAGDPNTPVARLGKKLYFETALSINNQLSCNSCHKLDEFGVDNLPASPGHEGKTGDRNSPTVYNAYFHVAQFWDGRAADLAEQAKGPILNPVEMGIPDEKTAVNRIRAIQEYPALFAQAFPGEKDPITYNNIATAIAEFEKSLATPCNFDKYLSGDMKVLTEEEHKGLQLFVEKGCVSCHMGPGLGGSMYQKFGLVNGPYWTYTGSKRQDKGRSDITKRADDEYFFKVPSLRNIAKTAPYFHDGSVATLEEAVRIMGTAQLGQDLKEEEVKAIVAFLNTLTGEIPAHALANK